MTYNSTRLLTMFDGASINSSTRTSNSLWVGDATNITAMYSPTTTAASVVSVHFSNSDGFFSALTTAAAGALGGDWFAYTSIATTNAWSTLSAGVRWLRFIRSATDSQASLVVQCDHLS